MKKVMFKINEVIDLINSGKRLIIAGEEKLLKQLPKGNWIGGTTPYFMAENGGMVSNDLIMINEIPDFIEEISIKSYDIATIKNVYKDGYGNGFSIIILPSFSETHLSFAINAPDYKDFATKPLIGWISGILLDNMEKESPKTFFGDGKMISEKNAVVLHAKLPANKYGEIEIINIFEQGTGDSIEFLESGFQVKDAIINGEQQNFSEYLNKKRLNIKLPLVADYNSTKVNISFQSINKEERTVTFYAPVFKGVIYKQAAPVNNYIEQFVKVVPDKSGINLTFSCNCILNYLYSELEGKKTGDITGPITFGEIAYQLLNQTMVNLEIKDI
jgi:hypothetical protein